VLQRRPQLGHVRPAALSQEAVPEGLAWSVGFCTSARTLTQHRHEDRGGCCLAWCRSPHPATLRPRQPSGPGMHPTHLEGVSRGNVGLSFLVTTARMTSESLSSVNTFSPVYTSHISTPIAYTSEEGSSRPVCERACVHVCVRAHAFVCACRGVLACASMCVHA